MNAVALSGAFCELHRAKERDVQAERKRGRCCPPLCGFTGTWNHSTLLSLTATDPLANEPKRLFGIKGVGGV